MSKAFVPFDPDQVLLLPPSLHDWLPEGHLARFLNDVVDELDLSAIYASYEADPRGQAAYDPAMMVRLLLYGYCIGKSSSRKIERATYDEVAFRYLSADQHPDHDTIAAFRQRHLAALSALFVQVLQLCQQAGLVKLGHVAIDGTKIKANAARRASKSYAQMADAERQLQARVAGLLAQAAREDGDEDARFGRGKRGDELPPELADAQTRLRTIRAAKAALEAQARERAVAAQAAYDAETQRRERQPRKHGRDQRRPPSDPGGALPADDERVNLSDPDARVMRDGATRAYVQAYNAQLAVDDTTQIIVAASVTQDANDCAQLLPVLAQVQANLDRLPRTITADTGYFSLAAVTGANAQGVTALIPPHAQPKRTGKRPARPSPAVVQMRERLASVWGRTLYARRKYTVEPVIGVIKEQRQFRTFRLRGLRNVSVEWNLICLAHNLLKLFTRTWSPQPA